MRASVYLLDTYDSRHGSRIKQLEVIDNSGIERFIRKVNEKKLKQVICKKMIRDQKVETGICLYD